MATEKMNAEMTIWERVVRFKDDLSPTAARALLKLQFSQDDRKRMSELAAKARAGTLSADEDRETEAFENLGCLLDILHSKSRIALKRRRAS